MWGRLGAGDFWGESGVAARMVTVAVVTRLERNLFMGYGGLMLAELRLAAELRGVYLRAYNFLGRS